MSPLRPPDAGQDPGWKTLAGVFFLMLSCEGKACLRMHEIAPNSQAREVLFWASLEERRNGGVNNVPTRMYRTAPLAGAVDASEGRLLPRRPLRYLARRGNHYDGRFKLNLSGANKKDLVEYLKGM
jgi:hypothetical protein